MCWLWEVLILHLPTSGYARLRTLKMGWVKFFLQVQSMYRKDKKWPLTHLKVLRSKDFGVLMGGVKRAFPLACNLYAS